MCDEGDAVVVDSAGEESTIGGSLGDWRQVLSALYTLQTEDKHTPAKSRSVTYGPAWRLVLDRGGNAEAAPALSRHKLSRLAPSCPLRSSHAKPPRSKPPDLKTRRPST